MVTVRIWDLPTRLFHGLLALCFAGLIITGNIGGNAMLWHFRLGYAVFGLLLFRFAWGFMGGHWSRWSQLPLSPGSVRAYLGGQSGAAHRAGHNPLGSWSVLTLLLFLSLQVATGLVSDDEIANMGPLSSLAPGNWVALATSWHKHWGKLILILLVSLHLLAIAWYSWRQRQALVPAMWHGDKQLDTPLPASRDQSGSRWLAAVVMLLASIVAALVVASGS